MTRLTPILLCALVLSACLPPTYDSDSGIDSDISVDSGLGSDVGTDTDLGTDAPIELTDIRTGVTVSIPAGALPAGVSAQDVALSVETVRPAELGHAVALGLTPIVVLEPMGTVLSMPMTLTIPVSVPSRRGTVAVDPSIVDAISQGDINGLASAPGLGMASLYAGTGQALSNAVMNAFTAQQSANALAMAVASQGVAHVLGSAVVMDPGSMNDSLQFLVDSARGGSVQVLATFETDRLGGYSLIYFELDGDDNGIHDLLEGPLDLDADSLWSFEDWDNDGDHIADVEDGLDDADTDGDPAMNDADADGDGNSDDTACDPLGACGTAFREGTQRVICLNSDDALRQDIPIGEFITLEYELVPGSCPTTDVVSSCTSEGGGLVYFYGGSSEVEAAYCADCSVGTATGDVCQRR